MAKELVTDELWEVIEPLLPPEPPKPQGGRPRVDDRAALSGIIFVLKSGIPWERLHRVLLDRLGKADQIEWERACLDSASIPAKRGGQKPERIRQIKERRARSATLFQTEEASRCV
jgi:transposase